MGAESTHAEEWDEAKAKSEITRLVEDYERSKLDGRLSRFSEEETKKDFILPLFRALGWRVDSSEVSAEERILRGRADYGFKIGGVTKFYVEAKPLSKDIWERGSLQQVIDYSYAKGVPWAVLTNFARTVVLYSEAKDPNPFNSGFLDLAADKYLAEFDRLRLLSRLAVANNELDSKAETFGRKPRKQPIDKQLLKDLNSFRLDLAKDIRRLNGERFQEADEALEETVQRILDRLIFIRVAEDRGLEDKQLSLLSKGPESTAAKRLRELFRRYDDNFDSKLFQPHAADDVRLDGEVVQRVLRGLHETEDGAIRYDFAAIDADVLGVMYEQYLGLVLHQTAKRAKLADGAVNRKEQGIYYTPTWVVDYIVKFSIREALKRKGARPEKLRILDPACGSGTFLLRAFDHIMRARNPTGASVQARFDPDTAGPLLALRTSVLTENLFGVDLDARAVEIAQLNLMIRAAESRHRLPTLERNVRVGNSVVADPAVDPRALDWTKAFPEAIKEGGFDVIVTNPPYVRIQNLDASQAEYLESRFNATGDFDLYTFFVQEAWDLLRPGGVAGFILPSKFLTADYGAQLRTLLADQGAILRLMHFGDYQVFEDATTYTSLLFLRRARSPSFSFGSLRGGADPASKRNLSESDFEFSALRAPKPGSPPWALMQSSAKPLYERLGTARPILADITRAVFQGFRTGCDQVFIVRPIDRRAGFVTIESPLLQRQFEIESDLLRPIARGDEMRRWIVRRGSEEVLFPYRVADDKPCVIPFDEIRRTYPRTADYFEAHSRWLKDREHGAMAQKKDWHQFSRPQNLVRMTKPKLLVQEISARNQVCFDQVGEFCFVTGYGIELADSTPDWVYYVEAVLNSRPVEFYHHLSSTRLRGGFYSYRSQFLEPLPIPEGTPESRSGVVKAAKELTDAHARLRELVEGTDRYREALRGIDEFEARLDRLTLDLFEITPEEEKLLTPRIKAKL